MRRLFFIFSMLQLFIATANAQADRQHIRQGNKLYRQEKYDKAEVEYQKALAANQRNPQAIYNLGCAMMMQQKDSAAIVQFENAGKLETDKRRKSMAFHNMGWICQKHQMYAEAIEAYKESLRNNPDDNETRYNLALCQRQQKKNQQNQGGGGKDDKKQDDEQDKKDKKDQNQQQDQQKQQQPPPKDQMSKENAEQLLNAAMQEEKQTQERMKKAQQQPQKRRLEKNW